MMPITFAIGSDARIVNPHNSQQISANNRVVVRPRSRLDEIARGRPDDVNRAKIVGPKLSTNDTHLQGNFIDFRLPEKSFLMVGRLRDRHCLITRAIKTCQNPD